MGLTTPTPARTDQESRRNSKKNSSSSHGLIKKPKGKITMSRFRNLISYSNQTHRILKARVRALILEFKLNTKVVIEDGFLRGPNRSIKSLLFAFYKRLWRYYSLKNLLISVEKGLKFGQQSNCTRFLRSEDIR